MKSTWPIFAFDNYFKNADRSYSDTERWDTLKALGYDQGYLSISLSSAEDWGYFLKAHEHAQRTGLGLAAVYTSLNMKAASSQGQPSPADVLEHLKPGDTFEIAIPYGAEYPPSDPSPDDEVIAHLAPLIAIARKRGVTISLYHHFGFWMERIEDCVRLAKRINDSVVRVTFCGYHWYAVDPTDLAGKLRLAAPWLHRVNLCGARPIPSESTGLPATIEPVGEGEFPLDECINELRAIQFHGSVGFQGYQIGGHPPDNLRRSIEAFRAVRDARLMSSR